MLIKLGDLLKHDVHSGGNREVKGFTFNYFDIHNFPHIYLLGNLERNLQTVRGRFSCNCGSACSILNSIRFNRILTLDRSPV